MYTIDIKYFIHYAWNMKFNISAKELRERLAEMLNTAIYGKRDVYISRHGKPQAVIVDSEKYEWMSNPRSRFSDKEWQQHFVFLERMWKRTTHLDPRKTQKVVDKAIEESRRQYD